MRVVSQRTVRNAAVAGAVGGQRCTPALCLGASVPAAASATDLLWFAQGLSSGAVNIFSCAANQSQAAPLDASTIHLSLYFSDFVAVTELAWNATRQQLAVVHDSKVSFFFLRIGASELECIELHTYEHARGSIATVKWLSVDPAVIIIDRERTLVAYDTARQSLVALDCPEPQTMVEVGRTVDEIASFGSGDGSSGTLYVWDLLNRPRHSAGGGGEGRSDEEGGAFTVLRHDAPLRGLAWCPGAPGSGRCLLISATTRGVTLWSKSADSLGGSCYIRQREISIEYDVSDVCCLSVQRHHALLLLRERAAPLTVHRLLVATHLSTLSEANSLELKPARGPGAASKSCGGESFGCFTARFKGGSKHFVSLSTNDFVSLWEAEAGPAAGSAGPTSPSPSASALSQPEEVACASHWETLRGDQSKVELVEVHPRLGMVLTVDVSRVVHIWGLGKEQESVLVDEFTAEAKVVGAAWVAEAGEVKSASGELLLLLEGGGLYFVRIPGDCQKGEAERWPLACDLGCASTGADMVLLSCSKVAACEYAAEIVAGGSVVSVDMRLEHRDSCTVDHASLDVLAASQPGLWRVAVPCPGRGVERGSFFLGEAEGGAQLLHFTRAACQRWQLANWPAGSNALSASLSQDLVHLFVLVRSKDSSFHVLVFKRSLCSKDYVFHSTLIQSKKAVAFDILPLPYLDPVAMVCNGGKARMYHFDSIRMRWASWRVADMLPDNISHVKYLNSKRLLVVSNEQLLAVNIKHERDSLGRKLQGGRAQGQPLDGIQLHLSTLYSPFDILSLHSVMECVVSGSFKAFDKQVEVAKEYLDHAIDQGAVRDLFHQFFEASGGTCDRVAVKDHSAWAGDFESLGKLDHELNGNDGVDYPAEYWKDVLTEAKATHGRFMNLPSMTSTSERLLLWYTHQSVQKAASKEGGDVGRFWGLSDFDAIWGVLDCDTEAVLQSFGNLGKFTWDETRLTGLGYWIDSKRTAVSLFDKVAKAEFLRKRDPHDCAIFYIALDKANILAGLCRATQSTRLGDFLKRNFNEEANQVAALKNAYALLGQHRYQLSAAFFLLARKYEDAVEVCVKNLEDVQLGLCIALLTSSDEENLRSRLISGTLMAKAQEKGDIHKCVLLHAVLKDGRVAMDILTKHVVDKEKWVSMTGQFSRAQLCHFVHLIADVYWELSEKHGSEAGAEDEVAFVVHLSEVIFGLGNSRLTIRWCKMLAASGGAATFSGHEEALDRVLEALLGRILLSYATSLHFLCGASFPELVKAFDGLLLHARMCFGADVPVERGSVALEGVRSLLMSSQRGDGGDDGDRDGGVGEGRSGGVGSAAAMGAASPQLSGLRTPKRGRRGKDEVVFASAIQHLNKGVKALKANPCDPSEVVISTNAGLLTSELSALGRGGYGGRIDSEVCYQSKFPQDCWTVPILSENRTLMPQWAVLNISKANVAATCLTAHPHRPLFVSNGINDVMLLWHFHQQSAMSCFRLPAERHKAKVKGFSFDASGEKIACVYSTGVGALFSVDSLPSNGTNIDCDAIADVFGDGSADATDVTFLGDSSSVVLGTGPKLFLWDTLSPRGAHSIGLRKMGTISKLCMPAQSYTFLCGDAAGKVGLFDVRQMAPVMVPIWSADSSAAGSGPSLCAILPLLGQPASRRNRQRCWRWGRGHHSAGQLEEAGGVPAGGRGVQGVGI